MSASTKKWTLTGAAATTALILLFAWTTRRATDGFEMSPKTAAPREAIIPRTLQELLARPATGLEQGDTTLANLLCAQGLPGADDLDVRDCLTRLDQWAKQIKAETERHLYRFRANPAEFDNSEGYFRMLMMAVVVYEDFRVHYNPRLIESPTLTDPDDHFFADSGDVFLHGLLSERRMGTCSSMPVLYVALGRRLGYPLKLVTTKAHLFVRWEGAGERFNLEATGKGMNHYDDDHFREWPFAVNEEEIEAEGYLKSLSPAEELAVFLSIRGHCLREAGRWPEAAQSFAEAASMAPNTRGYQLLLADAKQRLALASGVFDLSGR